MVRRWLMLQFATCALAAGAVSCPGDGTQSMPTLSVVTVNMANAIPVNGVKWPTRVDRLTAAIASAELVPDIISLTESAGWWNCSLSDYPRVDDYDMLDRLLWNLRGRLGAEYRIAYMVGYNGAVKNDLDLPVCWYFSGDTLLYNSDRLVNLTPDAVAGSPQVADDDQLIGFQIRRSLPLCLRRTSMMPLEQLIDGPEQTDRCSSPTPSGPAFVQVELTRSGDHALVASLARFSLRAAPGSSFDVVTTHPTSGEEALHAAPINDFIAGMTQPPYRTTPPYYPVIVLGDFNSLKNTPNDFWNDPAWPAGTRDVFTTDADVMVVAVGAGVGLQPEHDLSVAFATALPREEPCRIKDTDTPGTFSDHCGLVVWFTGS
ncbi:MAG: endonuclease/exonuclease/phosphatase family protein [Actinomycetota bacterium]